MNVTTTTGASASLLELIEKRLDSGAEVLVTLPRAAQQALAAAQDPECSLTDLERVVGADPALAARLMRVANSSFYRGLNEARTIPEAAMRLGLKGVVNLILAMGVKGVYTARKACFQVALEKLWSRAVASSVVCRELARATLSASEEEAFLAGLVQDIGQGVILVTLDELALNDPRVAQIPEELLAKVLQGHHERLGGDLLGKWGFPGAIVAAVAHHHLPPREGGLLPWVLAASDLVMRKIGLDGAPLEPDLALTASTPMHMLQLGDLALARLLVDLEERAGEWNLALS